ncbi:MAG: hypothetical protein WA738_08460 [Candidatus Angelobacter sp.]
MLATSETVYVLVKQYTPTKTPLSPDLRRAITAGASRLVTDHAGYFGEASSAGRQNEEAVSKE